MKRKSRFKGLKLLGLLTVAIVALTGCQSAGVPLRKEAEVTLPPADAPYVAPIGDAALAFTDDAVLYLPRYDGTRLISMTDAISFSASRLDSESVVRALLLHAGNGVAAALGGNVKLSLYGVNPVEVSGNVATVNLAASALQLDRRELYLCSQAIANTLDDLGTVQYVNVLVMDKQIGLDLASTLPTGTLTRSVADDVGAAYDQALSSRVEPSESAADKRLSVTATLYFPLSAVNGMMPDARNISFTSQTTEQMVLRLLEEMSEGPVRVSGSPTLPLLKDMLSAPPVASEPTDGGGTLITLRFEPTLDDMLGAMGVSRASCLGAVCYTLTTFLPNIAGVEIYIGEERIDHVMLGATDGILFDNGIQKRANYASLLMDNCTLYFPDAEGKTLRAVQRAVPYNQRTSPRSLLMELFRGPTEADSQTDTQALLTGEALSDADILGISLQDQVLLVNFSSRFSEAGKGLTNNQDRLLAYAMVNTLLNVTHAHQIRFFVSGNVPEDFSGAVYWAGPFYQSFGMVAQ